MCDFIVCPLVRGDRQLKNNWANSDECDCMSSGVADNLGGQVVSLSVGCLGCHYVRVLGGH